MSAPAWARLSRSARWRLVRGLAEAALDGTWERATVAQRLLAHVDEAEAARLSAHLLWRWPHAAPENPLDAAEAILARVAPLTGYRGKPEPPTTRWRAAVPRWTTVAEPAALLDVEVAELDWFADLRGYNRRAARPLRHYRERWVGGSRLIEAPKPRLAEIQRRLSRHVLAALPVHDCAHGFRPGRDAGTFAAPHARRPLVLRMDVESFFPSITIARVAGLLGWAGYRPTLARLLAGLLTTATPPAVLRVRPDLDWPARRRYAARHLPQGAPSSPAVANAVCGRLDRRLAALSRDHGARYTRYADDLAFSFDAVDPRGFASAVQRIVREEGFRVRPDKTRVMRAHRAQHLAGLVVNTSPAPPRGEFDALKALLHNCVHTSPQQQNTRGHRDFAAYLRGRIEWVTAGREHRRRKLLALYRAIEW